MNTFSQNYIGIPSLIFVHICEVSITIISTMQEALINKLVIETITSEE